MFEDLVTVEIDVVQAKSCSRHSYPDPWVDEGAKGDVESTFYRCFRLGLPAMVLFVL